MELKDVGEKETMAWIKDFLCESDARVPVGDDAAVIDVGGKLIALCSDMIQDKSHIYPGMTPYQAGRKVAVVNFSDLASMGARPLSFLMSLSARADYPFDDFKEIFRGVRDACADAGADFVGGDLNRGGKLLVDGFALGEIEDEKRIMRRRGARPGDMVAVTGNLGSAATGWQIVTKGLDLSVFESRLRREIEKNIIGACLEPKARVAEGLALAKSGGVTSCTDISDGLAFSLSYMMGGYGFQIEEESLPVERGVDEICESYGLNRARMVYHIGEDFELLCTIRPESLDTILDNIPSLSVIGRVIKENCIQVRTADGKLKRLEGKGYNHFE